MSGLPKTASWLMHKLSALVPPPRANLIVYRVVLAGHAAWRSKVVPKPVPRKEPELRPERVLSPMPQFDGGGGRWMPWADVLERVFHVDGFLRPTCVRAMRVRCRVQGRAARKVVEALATGPLCADRRHDSDVHKRRVRPKARAARVGRGGSRGSRRAAGLAGAGRSE